MRQCPRHQAFEGFICFFRDCPTRKSVANFLCQECYLQDDDENPHQQHKDSCISIQDLQKDFQNHVNTITNKEQKLNQFISQCQTQLVNLEKKKLFINGLLDELNKYIKGTVNRLLPTIMNTLEKVSMKPLHIAPEDSYQVLADRFAVNELTCSCSKPKNVEFLCLEKNIKMGERTWCAECQNNKLRNISIDDAKPIIQRAEQEEMYFNEMQRVKKEMRAIENVMTEAFSKLEIVSNYKSMFFSKAFATQFKSVKAILKQNPGRQQYQNIAEFLSSYNEKSEEKFDYRELTTVYTNLKNVQGQLKELIEVISNFESMQKGYNYSVICEIYMKNDFKENKILVMQKQCLVGDFINLIIQVCPYLGEIQRKIKLLNNFDFEKIKNQPLQSIILDKSCHPKVKLIYN